LFYSLIKNKTNKSREDRMIEGYCLAVSHRERGNRITTKVSKDFSVLQCVVPRTQTPHSIYRSPHPQPQGRSDEEVKSNIFPTLGISFFSLLCFHSFSFHLLLEDPAFFSLKMRLFLVF
jgi:hypothetical protein